MTHRVTQQLPGVGVGDAAKIEGGWEREGDEHD